jgi:hypothetical protein
LITPVQLEVGLKRHRETGIPLHHTLVELGFARQDDITAMLARIDDVPIIDISTVRLDPAVLKLVPAKFASRNTMLPLSRVARTLMVAVEGPVNWLAIDDLRFITRLEIAPVIVESGALRDLIREHYEHAASEELALLDVEDPTTQMPTMPPPPPPPPPGTQSTGEFSAVPSESNIEPVMLGASAPTAVRPGEEFTARIAAYLKRVEKEVEQELKEMSPRSAAHLAMARCRWREGTRITIRARGRYLRIDPSETEFTWEGDRQYVSFGVAVARRARTGGTVLKFEVAIKGVVVARLMLDLTVSRIPDPTVCPSLAIEPATTAFASYASEDRDEVLGRVASVSEVAGLNIFVDSMGLRTGKRWKDQLQKEITTRQLFLLFWSARAKRSKWVTWEWKTALKEKGLDAIQPHPLEPVAKAPPPKELKKLHFGNAYLLVREAHRRQ